MSTFLLPPSRLIPSGDIMRWAAVSYHSKGVVNFQSGPSSNQTRPPCGLRPPVVCHVLCHFLVIVAFRAAHLAFSPSLSELLLTSKHKEANRASLGRCYAIFPVLSIRCLIKSHLRPDAVLDMLTETNVRMSPQMDSEIQIENY